ncbi:unnamed protein product [Moneuplotes crassus]|uniref:Cyclin n=1 Tax=Euplotes crassus TaxID=5936 RepID=A0AAD1Y4D1_EUPCR|nr:unnamed protein product [Moneuplotes crassus]
MMPNDFNHMANIITVLFEQIIARNHQKMDQVDGTDSVMEEELDEAKIFENSEITKFDFFDTVYQITSVLGQSNPCLISALIVIDRFSVKNPSFMITQDNIQRLLVVSVSSTAKMHDDFYFSNKSWCQLTGMDVRSYNKMESLFIKMMDFDFNVDQGYYNTYCKSLYTFIQSVQKDLRRSFDQICRYAAAQEETQSEIPA